MSTRRLRVSLTAGGFALLLLAGMLASALLGQLPVSPAEVLGALLHGIGVENAWAPADPLIESTLWVVRFPRLVMAMAVGAALATAGAVMQAIFGNPLAEQLIQSARTKQAIDLSVVLSTDLPVSWPGAGVGNHREPYFTVSFAYNSLLDSYGQTHILDSHAGTRQLGGDLADIDIHPAGLAPTKRREGRGMEGEYG